MQLCRILGPLIAKGFLEMLYFILQGTEGGQEHLSGRPDCSQKSASATLLRESARACVADVIIRYAWFIALREAVALVS